MIATTLPELERIIANPISSEVDDFLYNIRSNGIFELKLSPLRFQSRAILERAETPLSPALKLLLTRIQNAGLFPSYFSYLGLEMLTPQMNATTSSQLARQTFRLVYDLLNYMLEIPDFWDHPERSQLEKRVHALQDKSRAYIFTKELILATPEDVVKMSLIPESNVREELIFLRILQCTDVIFFAATRLVDKAIEAMTYGDVLNVMAALHWVKCLEEMLIPLLRPLAVMKVTNWLAFRYLIDAPSAIQSLNFHNLNAQLELLKRISQHPRVPKEQQRYLSLSTAISTECLQNLHHWYYAHLKIAIKYGQNGPSEKSAGVQWLEAQTETALKV